MKLVKVLDKRSNVLRLIACDGSRCSICPSRYRCLTEDKGELDVDVYYHHIGYSPDITYNCFNCERYLSFAAYTGTPFCYHIDTCKKLQEAVEQAEKF